MTKENAGATTPYCFTLINSIDSLRALLPVWAKFMQEACNPSLFLRPEWLISWWESFAQTHDQLAVVWIERNGEPFALAPFFVRQDSYYGLRRRILRFVGEGNSDRSDILLKVSDEQMYSPLFAFLRGKIQWDIASFREVPEESGLLSWAAAQQLAHVEQDSDCPFIAIAPDLTSESFRAGLSLNLRREFANVTNRLKKAGKYRFSCQELHNGNAFLLESICEIERHSSKASSNINLVFSPERNNNFQCRLLAQFDETVQPLLTTLELDENIIAYLYGFVAEGVYHAYNMAFLPEYIRFSPGKLTMQATIDHCITKKMREFDFLRGNSYIKSKWTSNIRHQYHLTLMEKSFLNQLHARLIFSVRPQVKKMLANFRRILSHR
jgi:CelD/BcsL family acetyltransferase involved in cellulose biosynthesis